MCRNFIFCLFISTFLLIGCGSDDETPVVTSKDFTYTLVDSGGYLDSVDGRRVVVITRGFSGDCANKGNPTEDTRHTADAAVTTSGSVILRFTLTYESTYFESIYIDVNGTNILDNGDRVWWSNTDNYIAGYCRAGVANLAAEQSFDWTSVADTLFDGTRTWSGGSAPFFE